MALKKYYISENRVQLVNKQFRVADLFQAYLPALMIVVLAALVIFNLGYFYALDWHYLHLLKTEDYYGGTLPFLVFVLILYSSLAFQAIDVPNWPYQRWMEVLRRLGDDYDNQAEGVAQARKIIDGLWNSRLERLNLKWQIFEAKCKTVLCKLLRRPKKHLSVERLKKISASEEMHRGKLLYQYELLKPRLKAEMKGLVKIAAEICGISALGAFAAAGLYLLFLTPVYGEIWREKPSLLLWGIVITALLVLADTALQVSYRRRRWLLLIASVWMSFYCGVLGFHQDLMQTEVKVIDKDETEHDLIRAVSRGYFVRDGKEIVFIPRDNALRLEQHLKEI